MPKFTSGERRTIEGIVGSLSIKRIPDLEIIKEVFKQTNHNISRQTLYNVRQRIKKKSFDWYQELKQSNYEYIHEFKERINEIVDLQRRHYKIIEDNSNNAAIAQTSLSELHKLNITLSNYFDVAPTIVNTRTNPGSKQNDNSISISQQETEIIV